MSSSRKSSNKAIFFDHLFFSISCELTWGGKEKIKIVMDRAVDFVHGEQELILKKAWIVEYIPMLFNFFKVSSTKNIAVAQNIKLNQQQVQNCYLSLMAP